MGDVLDDAFKDFRVKHEEVIAKSTTFEEYLQMKAELLRASILKLRYRGIPGRERARVNNRMQYITFERTRQWLFAKDPTCGICGLPIDTLAEVTIDHVIPKFVKKDNSSKNKQIAHFICNTHDKNNADRYLYWVKPNAEELQQ